ncbi:immunity protein Imm33 domain-containing protein [Arthrobacter sp. AD-310]
MHDSILSAQMQLTARFGAVPTPPMQGMKVGVSRNVRSPDVHPLNGLRHPAAAGTSGWFIWRGEDLGMADDFFDPLHVEHLTTWCPAVVPYLALPAGWRFLLAPGHEDVWFDESLLNI